jgi:branched-chain amino acid transport system substrate-binding protein
MSKSKHVGLVPVLFALAVLTFLLAGQTSPVAAVPGRDRPLIESAGTEGAVAATNVLTVGVLGPFSGPSLRTGEEFQRAVTMAFDAAGWQVGPYAIELVWIDSQSDPSAAAQAYEQAILQDGVQAGLLNWHSSVAVACMDVAADYQVPHFAGMGATVVVNELFNSDRDRYGYWTTKWWPDPSKLNISYVQMLEDAIEHSSWSPVEKTVAVFCEDTSWGHAAGDAMREHFENAGWRVVMDAYFRIDQTDFTETIETFKALEPAVIAGTSTAALTAAAFLNQADDAGLNSVIALDGLGWFGGWYDFTESSTNYVLDQHPMWSTESARTFRDDFEARYGVLPSPSVGGLAYDAANFFLDIGQQAYQEYGELDSQSLYSFTQQQIWSGLWSYTDGIMMEEYKYVSETIPDPMVGEGYYMFPVVQYLDGEAQIMFPSAWADRSFIPPGAGNDGPTPLGESTIFTATLKGESGVTYHWMFGDGATGSGRVVSHTFGLPGAYVVEVTADDGSSSETARTLAVVYEEMTLPSDGLASSSDGVVAMASSASLSETLLITYTPKVAPGHTSGALKTAGITFQLQAVYLPSAAPAVGLADPLTLTIQYDEAALPPQLDEAHLEVHRYDAELGWMPLPVVGRDLANDRLSVLLDHFSDFALLGPVERIYLPVISR